MIIAVARHFKRPGIVPPRDLVFAFVSDEEAGGNYGAQWLVDHRPDLFDGVTEAIGEVGGFSYRAAPRRRRTRLYLIETAEKGVAWTAADRPRPRRARVDGARRQRRHRGRRGGRPAGPPPFPLILTDRSSSSSPRSPRDRLEFDPTRRTWRAPSPSSAPIARIVGATLRDTANPTMLKAGYKANVIPPTAEAVVDCRVLPGREDAFRARGRRADRPDVEPRVDRGPAAATRPPFDGDLVDAMNAALLAEDPRRAPCRTCCPAAPTQSLRTGWASAASASRRCGCRPTWTSPRCSTASTSGCPWTH